MQLHSHWTVRPPGAEETTKALAGELGLSHIAAGLLVSRGYTTSEAARNFLTPNEGQLPDPGLLPDMDRAVSRIGEALDNGERIGIYGDYDVDGQTSTALLVRGLTALGATPRWYIPERISEGYGLHGGAIDTLAQDGVTLLITVDCGSGAVAEVEQAARLGMDVIITDHHEPGEDLPPAVAFINPKRADSRYPFEELAGVGVAFQLMQAVWRKRGRDGFSPHAFELAAMGTVADVCPLVEDNRILVHAGLRRINDGRMPALDALAHVSGTTPEEVSATRIAFGLAPRLNAAGRVGHAELGVRLLLCDHYDDASPLAARLDEENRLRREIEGRILEEALQTVERENLLGDTVLVVSGKNWHPGVIGIVASRLVERFSRPAIVIGIDGDEGVGSARSIAAFDLFAGLNECADLLIRFGGHQMAAGLTVSRENIARLRAKLNEYAAGLLSPEDLVPQTRVDALVPLDEVTQELGRELERFAPFGMGNPTPVFAAEDVLVAGTRAVGKQGDHLKLTLKCPHTDAVHDGMGFGGGALIDAILRGSRVDVAFAVQVGEWRGRPQLTLALRALQSPLAIAERKAALADAPIRVAVRTQGDEPDRTIAVVDRRERAATHPLARSAYLSPLVDTGARVVVVTGAGDDPEALARGVSHALKADAEVVRDGDRLGRPRLAIMSEIERLPTGKNEWGGHGHLVLFGLPADEDVLWSLFARALAAPGWSVHLAYDRASVEHSASFLARSYPDEDALRVVYRGLRSFANLQTGALPPAKTVAGRLQSRWEGLIGVEGVNHALAVFEQLGLVEATEDGLRLVPQGGRKVDVASSSRYNMGITIKQQFAEYSRIALKVSPADLFSLAVERGPLDGFAFIDPGSARFSETGS